MDEDEAQAMVVAPIYRPAVNLGENYFAELDKQLEQGTE